MAGRIILVSAVATLTLACADSADLATSTTSASTTTATAAATTTTTPPTTEAPTTTDASGPVDVRITEGSGTFGSNPSGPGKLRLDPDREYRFVEFVPPISFRAPVDHWEVVDYSTAAVSLGWRGESGFRPGTLVVAFFGLFAGSVDESWERLEDHIGTELAVIDETLEWIDTGRVPIDGVDVDWRELRTSEERVLPFASSPCVIDLPGRECVWFDSAARFLVVPVDGLTVTILVTEQLCDCDLGALPGRFDADNELADWLDLIPLVLAGITIEG